MSRDTYNSTQSIASTVIKLTDQESKLRNFLLDVARHIDATGELEHPLVLRWAGGWVRDKLLNIPSHDIDTAINLMTGYSFCMKMKQFLEDTQNLQKHDLAAKDVGNLHKVAANPEKSKHLETTTIKIMGFDVDFVNLRKETYSAESRNPQMEFGTAEDDALRRDATVNALFYNLHTDQVEDFAEGLVDMRAGLIRTPLEPRQTFMDDPLRVLRLIRFASRLNFTIDPQSEASMSDASIRDALKLKISRERVGIEVEKMLRDKNPRCALQLFDRLGLYSTIFTDPTTDGVPEPSTAKWHIAYDCLEVMKANQSPKSVYQQLVRSEEATELSWVLATLTPWVEIPTPDAKKPGGKLPLPYATLVAREGIKVNNRTGEVVTAAFRHLDEITKFQRATASGEAWVKERDNLGMAIRRWEERGGHWKIQVIFAILVDCMRADFPGGHGMIIAGWQQLLDHFDDMGVMDAPSWKPLVDGKILSQSLGVKPGVWMKDALNVCMAWQFRNPEVTDRTAAVEEVRARAKELNIPL